MSDQALKAFALYIVSRPLFTLISVPAPIRPPVGAAMEAATAATTAPRRPVQLGLPEEPWTAAVPMPPVGSSVPISNISM